MLVYFHYRDLLSEFGQEFPKLLRLEAYNFLSKYDQKAVDAITHLFKINVSYKTVAPFPNNRAYSYPKCGALRYVCL